MSKDTNFKAIHNSATAQAEQVALFSMSKDTNFKAIHNLVAFVVILILLFSMSKDTNFKAIHNLAISFISAARVVFDEQRYKF